MDNFRKQLKLNRMTTILYTLAMLIAYVKLNFFKEYATIAVGEFSRFVSGLQAGICAVFVVASVINSVRITRALKDDDKLNEMYIKSTDERTAKIKKETDSTTASTYMVLLTIATIVSGYYSEAIFFTLLISLVVFVAMRGICKIRYSKKY